ncbi:MAG: sulfotransferase [Promethearchaeota archaeon]|nr:MAG: sulfotransferase [Candidatus Lokiarchaeota archaeon]
MIKQQFHEVDHVFPNFLGIGVERGGTTWLWSILKEHPQIYLCSFLKEIKFFDKNFQKGLQWYAKFFPSEAEAKNYQAIGEITPNYIFAEKVPERIQKYLSNTHFIIILRNPVNRAFSSYKYSILNEGIKESFLEHLRKNENEIKRGLYYQQIKNWFNFFPRDRFLILIFEEIIKEPKKAFQEIAEFLNVDFNKFPFLNLDKKVNPSTNLPRFHKIYLFYQRFLLFLKKKNLYDVYEKVIRLYLKIKDHVASMPFIMRENVVEMNLETKKELYTRYKEDINKLEKLLNKDLSIWKE